MAVWLPLGVVQAADDVSNDDEEVIEMLDVLENLDWLKEDSEMLINIDDIGDEEDDK